jgi:hypothetical protein
MQRSDALHAVVIEDNLVGVVVTPVAVVRAHAFAVAMLSVGVTAIKMD